MPGTPESAAIPTTAPQPYKPDRFAVLMGIICALSVTIVNVCILFFALSIKGVFETALRDHFLCVVGSPMAMMMALVIVIILRATDGPIEFKTPFGFEFSGASGPVVLWIFSWLACVGGMTAFWRLGK